MSNFETKKLPQKPDYLAPDGSEVRLLLDLNNGGMAHFKLPPNHVSTAVLHKTVEEIWFFTSGSGKMWRSYGNEDEIITVTKNVCITIPVGTKFQFCADESEALTAIAVTLPPWPGKDEAVKTQGYWIPTP